MTLNKIPVILTYFYKKEEITIRNVLLFLVIFVVLTGCARLGEGVHIYNHSEAESSPAEKVFQEDERLVSANAIFDEENLVAGVTVKTFSRFHKKKIENELTKKLEESYPDLTVTVSADNKIVHKTSSIIQNKEEEQLGKELEKLVSLLKEET